MTGIYKHCVSMSLDHSEVVEVHDDYVVIVDYLKPDPQGPYLVMSDFGEPTWAARKYSSDNTSQNPAE